MEMREIRSHARKSMKAVVRTINQASRAVRFHRRIRVGKARSLTNETGLNR